MKYLKTVIEKDSGYQKLLAAVNTAKLPVAVTGVSAVHRAIIAMCLNAEMQKKAVFITADDAAAATAVLELQNLGVRALLFLPRDFHFGDAMGISREFEQKRIDTLSALVDGAFDVLVCTVEAAIFRTIPKQILTENCFTLKTGDSVDTLLLSETLIGMGYTRDDIVDGKGKFAVRGGIIDIFAAGSNAPVRIELWGDEIDSIAEFDTETQRRTNNTDSVKITPACEVFCQREKLIELLTQHLKTAKKLSENAADNINRDIDTLKSGRDINIDRYAPLVHGKTLSVLDYIDDPLCILAESGNIEERIERINTIFSEDIKAAYEQGYISSACDDFILSASEFFGKIQNGIILDSFARGKYPLSVNSLVDFNWKRSSAWNGDIGVLLEDIDFTLQKGGSVVILAGEQRAAKILCEELNAKGIKAVFNENPDTVLNGVTVTLGGLSSGFELPNINFALITHRHILAERSAKRRPRPKNAKEIGSIEELKQGDYVVHTAHGIGIFDGVHKITSGGVTKDYIKIKYAKSDVLYVPVTQLDLVSKYIGAAADGEIHLHKLGGSEWSKTRTRVRAAVKDMAKQLIALYAKRMSAKGYAFSPDTHLQSDFERRFPYDETEDQLRCIDEIKGDMERGVPMDRLLCGDVGFGKTEVALRAAFKCVSEGKQCALLVPTTILAWQHYNTILNRFGDMPLNTQMLSRFVTPTKQKKIIKDIKSGNVDMIVGTHRMISSDIQFKDLGLVIIDEEQRFGVAQKEKLKEKYPSVDVLTLSATPIPRTLNMAMSGLRDMSSIDEAPGDRHPVQTYVIEHNNGVLMDAISKELRRGGQVYYLHNRVETIERCAARIKAGLPDARIAVAHGKMSEDELSAIWRQLMEHEIDVLVCTTIIETGVDVANVNTLIIEDADRFGLAQLHQLRGRVGRSPRRAYAYLCYRVGRQLSDIATKRLEAIREYTEFGSGFKIAMRDLEIRGAGNILGGEQHGNMQAVGYDMYLKLLNNAVNEEKGVETESETPCTVDLNISAFIPPEYIPSLPARLGIYRRIADIKNEEDKSDVIDELIDRFGEPPRAVMGLINIALVRSYASNCGIYEITGDIGGVRLSVEKIDPELLSLLSMGFGKRLSVLGSNEKPYYLIKYKSGQATAQVLDELLSIIIKK